MPKETLTEKQNNVIMSARPSMQVDLTKCKIHDGLFIYSMWEGYRDSAYQQKFENYLIQSGFESKVIHTSGHASVSDIEKVITGLEPKKIIPIHTMMPSAFKGISEKTELKHDGIAFEV
jgi:ribonuclease J